MLVLSRFPQQRIIIGGNIKITIVGIEKNGQVRVGIEAPKSIPVHRQEVHDAIQKDRETGHAIPFWRSLFSRKKQSKQPLIPTRGPPS